MRLSVYDLYLAGVGCDVSGAALLAWGLLARPRAATPRWAGKGAFGEIAQHARDFVSGWSGVVTLVVGFAFQAAGYLLNLSGHASRAHGARGFVAGVVVLVLAFAAPLLLWRIVRGWGTRRYALESAYVGEDGRRRERPSGYELWELGQRLGYPAHDDERGDYPAYAKRVFGVEGATTSPTEDFLADHHDTADP